uniref:Uncharacterized protein n=1 Tax=Arundo donax TaxID=35708 RepID=A0A0A9CZN1_ARUDO
MTMPEHESKHLRTSTFLQVMNTLGISDAIKIAVGTILKVRACRCILVIHRICRLPGPLRSWERSWHV